MAKDTIYVYGDFKIDTVQDLEIKELVITPKPNGTAQTLTIPANGEAGPIPIDLDKDGSHQYVTIQIQDDANNPIVLCCNHDIGSILNAKDKPHMNKYRLYKTSTEWVVELLEQGTILLNGKLTGDPTETNVTVGDDGGGGGPG